MFAVRLSHAIAAAALGVAVMVPAIAQNAPNGNVPLAVPIAPQPDAQAGGTGPAERPVSARPGGAVPNPVVMVVDAQRIIQQSKAGESIRRQLESQQEAYRKDIAGRQNELEQEQQELERDQRTLGATELEEKRLAFTKKYEQVQRDVDAKKRALGKGAEDASGKIRNALIEIIQVLAQERHANLVLLREAAILSDPAYDVTEDALRRLDQKLPSVTVIINDAPDATATSTPAPKKK